MTTDNERNLQETRQSWDQAAPTFDDQPDHGLRDPLVCRAWIEHFTRWLLPAPASILDMGCGTGSLSIVLAELGFEVTGLDLSPAMVAQAEAKVRAAGQRVTFLVMDTAFPQLAGQRFDAILCRHLLWALPEPARCSVAGLPCWRRASAQSPLCKTRKGRPLWSSRWTTLTPRYHSHISDSHRKGDCHRI